MVGKAIGIGEVRELMERLGITLNYKGFYYAVYAAVSYTHLDVYKRQLPRVGGDTEVAEEGGF